MNNKDIEDIEDIEDIYKNSIDIPLHNFCYLHHTDADQSEKSNNGFFLGRKKELDKMCNILSDEKSGRGAYLISGYRGCGKTSFINEVIRKVSKKNKKEKKRKVVDIRINLANDNLLDPYQIYKRMTYSLLDKMKGKKSNIYKTYNIFSSIIALFFLLTLLIFLLFDFFNLAEGKVKNFLCGNQHISEVHNNKKTNTSPPQLYECLFMDDSELEHYDLEKTPPLIDIYKYNKIINPKVVVFISLCLSLYFLFLIIIYIKLYRSKRKIRKLINLAKEISNETSSSFQIKTPFSFSRSISRRAIDAADIEHKLSDILVRIQQDNHVIFIFDELDKITVLNTTDNHNNSNRIESINKLLGSLKSIVSSNSACFIFIGGRDMHDAYMTQTGAVTSLYQSIFNESIYIPTLLSDTSDKKSFRLNSMIEKFCMKFIMPHDNDENIDRYTISNYSKEISELYASKNELENDSEYIVYSFFIIKNFINYLTLNSKGNYKILLRMFYEFVRSGDSEADYSTPSSIKNIGKEEGDKKKQYYLYFEIKDIQKILLSSNLYISFHYNLSRRLRHADDKLVVASISMLQFIIKFYNKGFSRRNLYNAYDAISSTSRPPELKGITEIILKNVLASSLRKSRYCITRYRFTSLFESEVRYISETSPDQSASYNFSLGSLTYLKKRYQEKIASFTTEKMGEATAMHYLSLGDVYFWEQSYDDAAASYLHASSLLRNIKPHSKNTDFIYNQTYIESMLKLGLTLEINHNYSEANNIYLRTEIDSKKIFKFNKKKISEFNGVYDAKFDYLTQGYWARLFLNIKRSPEAYKKDNIPPEHIKNMYKSCKEVMYYKLGIYYFYINRNKDSLYYFKKVVDEIKVKNINNERFGFFIGRSYLYFSLFNIVNLIKKESKKEDLVFLTFIRTSIKECHDLGSELEKINSTETCELIKKYTLDETNISSTRVLRSSIVNLLVSHKVLSDVELRTNAIYSHIAVVFIWGLFLEIYPSIIMKEEEEKEEEKNKYKNSYKFIENLCENSYSGSIKTHQKSFSDYIRKHYDREINNVFTGSTSEINPISKLIDILNSDKKEKNNSINRIYWQRSIQGQYLIELYLWQKRAYQNFIGDEKITDIDINNFPQFGIRSFSLALHLSGKNNLSKLKLLLKNEKITNDDIKDSIKYSSSAILYFYRAILYISQSSGNEQEVSFPPLSHVYYSLWETLFNLTTIHNKFIKIDFTSYNSLMKKIHFSKKKKKNKEAESKKSNKKTDKENTKEKNENVTFHEMEKNIGKDLNKFLQVFLYHYSNKHYRYSNETPYSLYDIDTLQKLAEKYLSRTTVASDCYSTIHKDTLFEKYYLQDDFDDPMFVFDLFHFKALSTPATLHLKAIDIKMKELKNSLKSA